MVSGNLDCAAPDTHIPMGIKTNLSHAANYISISESNDLPGIMSNNGLLGKSSVKLFE